MNITIEVKSIAKPYVYLTEKDRVNVMDVARQIGQSTSEIEVRKLARRIANAGKRNHTIDDHEQLICIAKEEIRKLHRGDIFTKTSLAIALRSDPRARLLCGGDSHTADTPMGAVWWAINDMEETEGIIKAIRVKKQHCNAYSVAYQRL